MLANLAQSAQAAGIIPSDAEIASAEAIYRAVIATHPCGFPKRTSSKDKYLALDDATPTASPDVSASPEASASAQASPSPEASATATSSASPAASSSAATPTPIPLQPVAPGGVIIPPTPRGNATATPPPLPTTAPTVNPSGPILIQRSTGMPTPLPLKGATPAPGGTASPSPSPTGVPSPLRTLGPNDVVTVADHLTGNSDEHQPADLTGNVHIFYQEGQVVGDRAHYDGDHTILVSGHTYLINRNQDSILYADSIAFDTQARRATLLNGSGESTEGVQQGKIHYTAQTLTSRTSGVSHGEHASFTTCENAHAGYHVEARELDVIPGDKLIAHKAVVFLGPTAILYLPLLVIPLVQNAIRRREASFIPTVGYDQAEGFFIKARIGFGTGNTYYGYYRLEYFTKRGLGLGYVAFIGAKDGHRYTTIDSYTINDRLQGDRRTNVNIADSETFTPRVRGQFGAQYNGDFGPNLTLPASVSITGSIAHQGTATQESLTFQRFVQGNQSDNVNAGFTDHIQLNQNLAESLNLAYSRFNSPLASNDTFHIQSDTHLYSKLADYDLIYDKTDYSAQPFGYDRLPEINIAPHPEWGSFKYAPTLKFTFGDYTEQQNNFSAWRFQGNLNEALFAKLPGGSDFSANYNITQDYYSTGDEKAVDQQSAALTTPLGNHLVNSITYNETHPIGPANVPFQLLDNLSGGSHSAQDVLRFYNKDVYSLSLSDGTYFNRTGQAITYQFNYRPSPRSYFVAGGFYQPGPGNGFATTNVQAITPFGLDTTLELSTNVDWKNHMRLEDKNIYLSRTVDKCYNLLLSYNQDLKQFSFNIVILAFPSQSAGFGFGGGQQSSPIIPQSFVFGS